MQLICNACYNYSYFTANVELVREFKISDDNIIVEDSICQDWNFSANCFRHLLNDIINYVKHVDMDAMEYNERNNSFENKYIECSTCGSKMVTVPKRKVREEKQGSLQEEINENKKEMINLRRRKNGHLLPLMQQNK